jgi:hypothetical protein
MLLHWQLSERIILGILAAVEKAMVSVFCLFQLGW